MENPSPSRIVIVGSGQAGVETAAALRQRGFEGEIVLIGDESDLPYQRPPLSKDFLKSDGAAPLPLRAESFYDANAITMRLGEQVVAIDRDAFQIVLASGERLSYGHLVLATGARNRMPNLPGLQARDIIELRTLSHARALLDRLGTLRHVSVLGGGFIGLEVASFLREKGIGVDVIEMADRLMGRVLSPQMSDWFRKYHLSQGMRLHFNTHAERLEEADGRGLLHLANGETIEADALVVSIGVLPNAELAASAGLETVNGIVVDERLLTADPSISAIGDCAAHPNPFGIGLVRLESVQNAVDQAKCVAARLTGDAKPYHSVPWFWSNQGSARLQIAGLAAGVDEAVTRGDPDSGKFSIFLYREGRLVCVESVNAAGDHMAARRILAAGTSLPPEDAANSDVDLKSFMTRPARPESSATRRTR